jgi:hypothetical protein
MAAALGLPPHGEVLPRHDFLAMEAPMLHSLQPAAFIVPQHLQSSCKCPECESSFLYRNGVMGLAHYLDENDDVAQGLLCFCSTTCLLRWEDPKMLGLMH